MIEHYARKTEEIWCHWVESIASTIHTQTQALDTTMAERSQ